jgi:hypothetical protein
LLEAKRTFRIPAITRSVDKFLLVLILAFLTTEKRKLMSLRSVFDLSGVTDCRKYPRNTHTVTHDLVCGEILNCTSVFRYVASLETHVSTNKAIETALKLGLIGVFFPGWQRFGGCIKVLYR